MQPSDTTKLAGSASNIVLGIIAALLVWATLSGKKLPLVSSERATLFVLLLLGMAMCTRGIGRVAAANAWTHPLAIVGYVLGGMILIVAVVGLLGRPLPLIATARQSIVAVSILTVAKLALSTAHALLM